MSEERKLDEPVYRAAAAIRRRLDEVGWIITTGSNPLDLAEIAADAIRNESAT